jgi:uncharacterized membrane protein
MLNLMVDSYLELRKVLSTELDHWQQGLLAPRQRGDADWGALMTSRNALHMLQDLCEEQNDAMQEWLDAQREQPPPWMTQQERDGLLARARDVVEHIQRVTHHVHRMEQSAETAVQIHFSAVGNRTNDIMRTLTALTAIFLPLNLIAGIFGMNFELLPLTHQAAGFWWTLGRWAHRGPARDRLLAQALPGARRALTWPPATIRVRTTGGRAARADVTRENVQAMRKLEELAVAQRTVADRVAEFVAKFCGSITFVWIHVAGFAAWIGWNVLPRLPHFDPYPFTFLTLCVSLEAIFLSSFILIAQNYEMRITERRNQLDLQINLLAEQENTKMLQLLDRMAKKMGLYEEDDPEIQVLEQATRPETLARQIEERLSRTDRPAAARQGRPQGPK